MKRKGMVDSVYTRTWDSYVEGWDERDKEFPGDEWGDPEVWDHVFRTLFVGVESWQRAVEIGPGSGKQVLEVLGASPDVALRAYDVSPGFMEVCAKRCEEHISSGRLSLRQLDAYKPDALLTDLHDWKREIDALYSIGVMVHIDLQHVIAYLITAAAVLRPGGKLITTFGTVATDAGFQRLLNDIQPAWGSQFGAANAKYEWVSGCLIESLLPRLGFEIDFIHELEGTVNLAVVATLTRPEVGGELVGYLS